MTLEHYELIESITITSKQVVTSSPDISENLQKAALDKLPGKMLREILSEIYGGDADLEVMFDVIIQ